MISKKEVRKIRSLLKSIRTVRIGHIRQYFSKPNPFNSSIKFTRHEWDKFMLECSYDEVHGCHVTQTPQQKRKKEPTHCHDVGSLLSL